MNVIKVSMCDDYEPLCVNMQNQFRYYDDIEMDSYCTEISSLEKMLLKSQPDILLLDVQLENKTSGIDVIPDILDSHPKIKIIMLTSYLNNNYIFDAIVNGASNYIVKNCEIDDIVEKIRSVYNNTSSLSPEIFKRFNLKSQEINTAYKSLMYMLDKIVSLSPTELEILKALYNGETYNEIAKKRVVEANTIRSMARRILRKFETPTMKELLKNLHEMKLFNII